MTKVRTTIEPGVVHEVDAAELIDLERQGLIYSREGDTTAKGEHKWQPKGRGEDIVTAPAPITATTTDTEKGA